MFYYVIHRSPNNRTKPRNKPTLKSRIESTLNLMPRYHYSRIAPSSATASSESFFSRNHLNDQPPSKQVTTTTTTSDSNKNKNNNGQYTYGSHGSLKSTYIPFVATSRMMTPNKREYIQVPVTREDRAFTANHAVRSIPITFISEANALTASANSHNNGNTNSKSPYASAIRPNSRYAIHHLNNHYDSSESLTNVPRLPSVLRRLSLTVPAITTATTTAAAVGTSAVVTSSNELNDSLQPSFSSSSLRLSQPSNAASIPTNSNRISSAILRPTTLSNSFNNQLQRQKTDLADLMSSDTTGALSHATPARRTDTTAREAIKGIVRFQQQRSNSTLEYNHNNNINNAHNNYTNNVVIRAPSLSRRVIINLKNNQSASLESRSSSSNSFPIKAGLNSSSGRQVQRNHTTSNTPVSQEIQSPSTTSTGATDTSFQSLRSPSASQNNRTSFKNEFHMEIPNDSVTINEQENYDHKHNRKEEDVTDYNHMSMTTISESLPSTTLNSNQTLKSILKRSTSREAVSRKNVSFMNV